MLQKLYIRNYAIIEELSLEFDEQMNVITGETGAGKSIILGALSLILGERADTSVLINREAKCIVEAFFNTKHNTRFNQLLEASEIDQDHQTIIRREISPTGKSRAFINDTPVTLSVLHQLCSALVDLHRQFDLQALEQKSFLYDVIDAVADSSANRTEYQVLFHAYTRQKQTFHELEEALLQWQKEADYKQFLLEELDQANFQTEEIEESEISLKQLSHAEQILNNLNQVYSGLEGGEAPLNQELKRLLSQLHNLDDLMPEAAVLAQRMESSIIELKDIAEETLALQDKVELNPEYLQVLQERIDLGYRLLKKHGLQNTADLIALQQELQTELNKQTTANEELEGMQLVIAEMEQRLLQQAKKLSHKRNMALPDFEQQINALLQLVGMPNGKLKIQSNPGNHFHLQGIDEMEFLLDANKSGQFKSIQKAASGGELSRIMLCIKALTAKALELPSLIFDEIDTGISGEAAHQVSILLQDLGTYHQVICITHLPQVAGRGRKHFFVYKESDEQEQVKTKVRELSTDDRIKVIAEMIGGAKPSTAAIENAKELVK